MHVACACIHVHAHAHAHAHAHVHVCMHMHMSYVHVHVHVHVCDMHMHMHMHMHDVTVLSVRCSVFDHVSRRFPEHISHMFFTHSYQWSSALTHCRWSLFYRFQARWCNLSTFFVPELLGQQSASHTMAFKASMAAEFRVRSPESGHLISGVACAGGGATQCQMLKKGPHFRPGICDLGSHFRIALLAAIPDRRC